MDTNVLYFLLRLYRLCDDFSKDKSFSEIYSEIERNTDKDIINSIPSEIKKEINKLCTENKNDLETLKSLTLPYAKECEELLGNPKKANEKFMKYLAEILCENGYRINDGAFRKSRRGRLFIIEAELVADFVSDDYGRVQKIKVEPLVRIADAKMKRQGKIYTVANGIIDDEATVSDIRLNDKEAFTRNLLHIENVKFDLGEEIELTDEELKKLAESASVAAPVCENRAIPSYYKKLCKNDFPVGKAFSVAVWSFIPLFLLILIVLGLFMGIGAYFAAGVTKFWGMLLEPYYYLGAAVIALIYALIAYKNARSGRY